MRRVMLSLARRHEAARLSSVVAALAGPGAEVDVVHVVELESGERFAEAVRGVEDAVNSLRGLGFTARGHVEPITAAGVAERLADRARARGAEVVVLGSRGLGHVGGLVGRSVSHALLAMLDVPVLLLPDCAPLPVDRFRRVLASVAAEGDVPATVAAVRLLPGPVEVLAVHVPRRVALHAGEAAGSTFMEIGETSTAVLAEALSRFHEAGIPATARTLARVGRVSDAITDAARTWDADLVVLGSRRLREWQALVAGSTSHDVLHRCDRPILVAGRLPLRARAR